MKLSPRGNPAVPNPIETRAFLTSVGNDLQGNLEAASPVGETGELSRSWSSKVFADSVVVSSDSDHSGFPEWGTRSPILPKPGNAAGGYLVFWSKGRKYVLKKVRGQRPQLYIFNTLRRMFPTSHISTRSISHFK